MDMTTRRNLPAAEPGTTTRRRLLQRAIQVGVSAPVAASLFAANGAISAPRGLAQSASPAAAQVTPGGILRIGASESPTAWDLHGTGLGFVYDILAPVYNTLITQDKLDPTGEAVAPDLAREWSVSNDGLTYTFALHDNVTWHDGMPFTSADVVASMEKIINPPEGVLSARQALFNSVESVTAPDDMTVQFQLSFPDAIFLEILAIGWNVVYPKHIMDEFGMAVLNDGDIAYQIGTGPFMLVDYQLNQYARLERNPSYFKEGLPYLDGIEFQYIPDFTARATAMLGGNLDVFASYPGNLQGEEAEILAQQRPDDITIVQIPLLSPIVLFTNTARAPFDDVRVRQAVSEAIDRTAVTGALLEGGAVGGLALPGSRWELEPETLAGQIGYGPDMAARQARATELLAEAGYTAENPLVINLVVRPGGDSTRIGTIIQPMLEAIGATVNIQQTTQAQQAELRQTGDFEVTVNLLSQTGVDPTHLFETYLTCGVPRNQTGICLEDGDEMIAEQRRMTSFDERKPVTDALQEMYLEQAAYNVISWRNGLGAAWNHVRDFGYLPAVYTVWGRIESAWIQQ